MRFAYPSSAAGDALRDVQTCRSRAGETVALVGETGAGKSTVLKLLARFYDPVSGRVAPRRARPARARARTTSARHLGYVPQEAFLFTGTVRDNIAYGRPAASDAEVEAAARAVGAHDVVAALPGGYLTELGERGGSLSSGQRQLIALARAQLADPALLLLDEATSNLDLATEARVDRGDALGGARPHDDRHRAPAADGARSPTGSSSSSTAGWPRAARTTSCSRRRRLRADVAGVRICWSIVIVS